MRTEQVTGEVLVPPNAQDLSPLVNITTNNIRDRLQRFLAWARLNQTSENWGQFLNASDLVVLSLQSLTL